MIRPKQPILFRGKQVGYIMDRKFIHPKTKAHLFRKYKAFGISRTVLAQIEYYADFWVVKYQNEGSVIYYVLPISEIRLRGHPYQDTSTGIEDLQYLISLKDFTRC